MTLATRTIDGNNSGSFFRRPKIVVMHATRSGIATKTDAEELVSTLNWFTNPNGASAHWVLSETERVRVVADALIAWHSAYLNGRARGIELTQPTIDRPFTDGHYANAALVGRHYVALGVAPVWLDYWDGDVTASGFVSHEDTIQGRESGKSDVGPQFDRQRFIASLEDDMAEMTQTQFNEMFLRAWETLGVTRDDRSSGEQEFIVDATPARITNTLHTHVRDGEKHSGGGGLTRVDVKDEIDLAQVKAAR